MALSLQGKVALITGASRGIGAAVAKRYAGQGAHVVLVARSVAGLEAVDDAIQQDGNGKATLVPMDLRQVDKIDQLAVLLAERFGKLDIVVGNAGVLGGLRPLTSITNKLWDEIMTVNVTANHRLIRVCDPLLQASGQGRAIFVSSAMARQATPYWGAYAASKAALAAMVQTYAAEVAHTKVKVNLVEPGLVNTQMAETAFPGRDLSICPSPEAVVERFVELAQDNCPHHGEILQACPPMEATTGL